MAKATVDAQYVKQVCAEMGLLVRIKMKTDAQAALQNASKLGPGRIRHLELQAAYLKECVRKKLIHLEKCQARRTPLTS